MLSEGSTVSWSRREKWARQLLEATCDAHAIGLVIQTFSCNRPPVLVDAADNIRLWRFRQKYTVGSGGLDRFPPEAWALSKCPKSTPYLDVPDVTPKADVWYLGRLLFCIAQNFPSSLTPGLSPGSQSLTSTPASSHGIRCVLPSMSKDVPLYYRGIVSKCRETNPFKRPPAWKLLELFLFGQLHSETEVHVQNLTRRSISLAPDLFSRTVPVTIGAIDLLK